MHDALVKSGASSRLNVWAARASSNLVARSRPSRSTQVSSTSPETCTARDRALHMTPLSLFGLFAVSAMLVFYALEHRNPGYILAFAVACALASVYGFLQGAWPFGLVEAVWSLVALRRWEAATRSS